MNRRFVDIGKAAGVPYGLITGELDVIGSHSNKTQSCVP